MSDFILRGYCEDCEDPIEFGSGRDHCSLYEVGDGHGETIHRPIWLISATQIKMLENSKLFHQELKEEETFDICTTSSHISFLLKNNPKIVAKCLVENKDGTKEV